MAKERSPAFQFYPKEFLTDGNVAAMSLHECGAYIKLICLCWQEGSLSADPQRLANMVGTSLRDFRKLWPALAPCFHEEGGTIRHESLDRERHKQEAYREQQRVKGLASGAARASGAPPGGNRIATAVQPNSNRGSTEPTTELEPNVNRQATEQATEQQPRTKSFFSGSSVVRSEKQEREERTSLSPADPLLNKEITERAGRFIERYQQLYRDRRHGARYALRPDRDYHAAVTLCQTWTDDARLDKLADIFLTTDHKFAEEGSRTIPQFLALASWADGRLAEWEAKQGASV